MMEGMPFATQAIPAQPDAATSFAEAFRVGRSLAQAGAAPLAGPPSQQGVSDPNAAASGVSQLAAHIDATPPTQRPAIIAQAQQSNEQLAHVLIGLKGYPPGQRLAIAQHLAQTTGLIDPNGVGAGDITDQGIDAHLAQAMAVEQFLKRESLYASIPPPPGSTAVPGGGPGGPSITARPDPRFAPTGAGHLTSAQLSTALGI
jgi:hypothetical protein